MVFKYHNVAHPDFVTSAKFGYCTELSQVTSQVKQGQG